MTLSCHVHLLPYFLVAMQAVQQGVEEVLAYLPGQKECEENERKFKADEVVQVVV